MEDLSLPSQLVVLLDEDNNPANLIFMSDQGTWVREDGRWVTFIVNDRNPKRRMEGMAFASVNPEILDVWDQGGLSEDDVSGYELEYHYTTSVATTPVAAAGVAYDFDGNPLVASLRRLVADNVWAYHHAQGYHWNVKGEDFAQYHELFQTIYEDYLSAIDPTAENLLKIGNAAPYTQEDLSQFRSIPDVEPGETPRSMVAALLAINDALRESTKMAFDEAANADQQGMVDFLGGRLDILDKWSWQLRSSIA